MLVYICMCVFILDLQVANSARSRQQMINFHHLLSIILHDDCFMKSKKNDKKRGGQHNYDQEFKITPFLFIKVIF